MGTTHDTLATRAGRPALLLLLLLLALALAATVAPAAARSGRGPGPFRNGRFGRDSLTLALATKRGAAPVSGAVSAFLADGSAEWRRFRTATAEDGGASLRLSGKVGDATIDEAFPDGAQRRLLVRDGDGRETELDAIRYGTQLVVFVTNRSPEATGKTPARSADATVEALADASVTVRFPEPTDAGYDVTVAATLPAAPDGASELDARLFATDASGEHTYSAALDLYDGDLRFFHFRLPAGTYSVGAITYGSYGNPADATSTIGTRLDGLGTIEVSRDGRFFPLAIPSHDPPTLVDATLVIDGLDRLAPTVSSRLSVSVNLNGAQGLFTAQAARDVSAGGPLAITFRLPAGTYAATVVTSRASDDPNGTSTSLVVSATGIELPGDARIAIPPLSQISGTIRDPDLALASAADPATGATPSHRLFVAATDGGTAVQASAELRGFARSYRFFAPSAATTSVSASLTATTDATRARASANDTVTVVVPGARSAEPPCPEDCVEDVRVPALPELVTIDGRVVDASGAPVRRAFVHASFADADAPLGFSASVVALDGKFTLRVPRAASYRISATAY